MCKLQVLGIILYNDVLLYEICDIIYVFERIVFLYNNYSVLDIYVCLFCKW